MRAQVAHTLGKLTPGDRAHAGIVPALERLAKDSGADVRKQAEESLRLVRSAGNAV